VYETMPTGYHYQRWMLAETQAIEAAVSSGKSSQRL
jgi:zinc/manganese transport system substrate-binding protein